MNILGVLRQFMFLQISFIAKKAISSILFPLHPPSQKLKGRRLKRKKKDRKLMRKIERISFNFFQLILSLFSIKRNYTEKAIEFIPSLIPFFRIRKNNEKRAKILLKTEEKKQKERKTRRKRRAFQFSLIL